MTTRKHGATRQAPKDALQFAPNFSAYLLPGTVCFYSEDRKFFLHGELFCAVVAEIAKGGKSARQLIDTLGRTFPPDKVEEAVGRLLERRYVLPSSQITDGVSDARFPVFDKGGKSLIFAVSRFNRIQT